MDNCPRTVSVLVIVRKQRERTWGQKGQMPPGFKMGPFLNCPEMKRNSNAKKYTPLHHVWIDQRSRSFFLIKLLYIQFFPASLF